MREMNAPTESALKHRWIAKEPSLQLLDIILLCICNARPQPCILDHSSVLHQCHWCSHLLQCTDRAASWPIKHHRRVLDSLLNHTMAQPGGSGPERAPSGGEPGSRRQRVQPGELPGGAAAIHEGGLEESSESSDPLLHTPEVENHAAGLLLDPLPHPGTTVRNLCDQCGSATLRFRTLVLLLTIDAGDSSCSLLSWTSRKAYWHC